MLRQIHRLRHLPGALLMLLGACGEQQPEPLGARVDAALARGLRQLVGRQSPDGAWRSEVYGGLKDRISLTPLVLKVLVYAEPVPGVEESRRRAAACLQSFIRPDGTLSSEFEAGPYPVYAAASCLLIACKTDPDHLGGGREVWLRELRRHQLTEARGWRPEDPAYGGWGYSRTPPTRPEKGRPPYDADLSSTMFAVGALAVAGVPPQDPAVRKARKFIERCQNHPPDGEARDPMYDDGGFFFTPTNEMQNKAGVAGVDTAGRRRFRSYGAMTADGLRALMRCGFMPDAARVRAARTWLEHRFTVKTNPGEFPEARIAEKDSSYYYWCWSLSHALRATAVLEIQTPDGPVLWARVLAEELLTRQRPDGTWSNEFTQVKEDDPLIATSFAVASLSICRLLIID